MEQNDMDLEVQNLNAKIKELTANIETLNQALLVKTLQYKNCLDLVNDLIANRINVGIENINR